jgi:sterol desaturase/sphingolipid hydroxylase (fatty acid hydroxylase superfamily)
VHVGSEENAAFRPTKENKQELHFVHHRHAGCNFAVIDNFWDRLLGTYRGPDGGIG